MSFSPYYLRSLLLAVLLSFIAPIVLIGGSIAAFLFLGSVPGMMPFGQAGIAQILSFLETFGSGSAWEGVMVIGCACAVVGALFDTYIVVVTSPIDFNKPASK